MLRGPKRKPAIKAFYDAREAQKRKEEYTLSERAN